MSYTKLGVINLALGKLGNSTIVASLIEDTAERIAATTVWEYILDEVLEAKEWKFAKTTVQLDTSDVTPQNGYTNAYPLPDDLLRLVRKTGFDSPVSPIAFDYLVETMQLPEGLEKVSNGTFTGGATGWTLGANWAYADNQVNKVAGGISTLSQVAGSMVSPPVVDELYLLEFNIVEIADGFITPSVGGTPGNPVSSMGTWSQLIMASSISSGVIFTPSSVNLTCIIDSVSLFKISDRKCVFIDYYDANNPLQVTYIRRIIDVTKYPPSFVSALAFRLAAEMAFKLTEGMTKYNTMIGLYGKSLSLAEGINQSFDFLESESGDDSWESAGR